MTNGMIADLLKDYANLYELHGGNAFKTKSYSIAAFRVDKMEEPLHGKSIPELERMEGIGKSLAGKIYEIDTTGSFSEMQSLLDATPDGVKQIMTIKGLGPKKIAFIWKELGIENPGELLYACHENRLIEAKGFGLKTQESIVKQIEFMYASADKFHYATLEPIALQLVSKLSATGNVREIAFSGALRRRAEVLQEIELQVSSPDRDAVIKDAEKLLTRTSVDGQFLLGHYESFPVRLGISDPEHFHWELFVNTGSTLHLESLRVSVSEKRQVHSEAEIYAALQLPYIEPELREGRDELTQARNGTLPELIRFEDLKGPLHNHSTWSDGQHSIEAMARYCIEKGYEYLGMADHSKSAFYAKGLDEQRVIKQQEEIDALNQKLAPFKILKGIESDILNDGSLDYAPEILASFDYVVASVHSNLKMSEEKAMTRLVKAIENPYTTILGHPTGRLLLMREGYPVDHKKLIDACAANGVVIELNANPYRLDIDWRWIPYALEKGVKLSINPDAHETDGFYDMYYGCLVARKGGLYKEACLNALSLENILAHFGRKLTAVRNA